VERGIYLGAEIRVHQSSLRPDGAPSVIPPRFAAHGAVWLNVHDMSNGDDDKTFLTHYSPINGVDYIFASLTAISPATNAINFTKNILSRTERRPLLTNGFSLICAQRFGNRYPT